MDKERGSAAAVVLATATYVVGWAAHVTFIFYLAPLALRQANAESYDAWVFTGTALASIVAAFPAGRLADMWPRRRVLRLGLALLAASYLPLLAPASLGGVLVATAITGTGLALMTVSFNAYLADLLTATGMGAAYGRTTGLAVVAGAVGPFVAAAVFGASGADALALRLSATLFGLAALAAALGTFRLPHIGKATTTRPGGIGDAWNEEAATIRPGTLVYLLTGIGAGMTMPYFAVYFLDHVRLAAPTWGVLLGFGTLASALGSITIGALGRRIAYERLLIPPQVGLLIVSLAFLLPAGALALGIAYVGRSLFQFTVSPTLNALMMSRVDAAARGRTQAWTNVSWNVGWAIGAAAGGALLGGIGGALFVAGALLALAGTTIGRALLSRAHGAPLR